MGNIQMKTVVVKDGVISMKVSGLPFKKGQQVKVTFKAKENSPGTKGKSPANYPFSSAGRLRNSPLIGMWKDRTDIGDSVEFARKLRERADKRQGQIVLPLDTDIMIDLMRNYPPAIAWLDEIEARREKVSLPGFVVMELVQGCRNTEEIKRVEKDVGNYITRWPSRAACKRSLAAYTKYHLSHGLGIIDSLICQIAQDQGMPFCTFNQKHFEAIFNITTLQPYKRRSSQQRGGPWR